VRRVAERYRGQGLNECRLWEALGVSGNLELDVSSGSTSAASRSASGPPRDRSPGRPRTGSSTIIATSVATGCKDLVLPRV
jgi:hypothetical protein